MLTENMPRCRMAAPVALPSFVQNSSMQGSSDTDVSELIVAPNNSPFHSVATTATPVAKAPMTERKRRGSIVCFCICFAPYARLHHSGEAVAPRYRSPAQHVVAELAGIGEIRHLPAVEVVFGHAIFGKTL